MNSCVLMAKIVRSPQLRYTQDNQLAVAEMMVEFENPSPNSPPATLKVVGWGNLATELEQNYREGDLVILSGRLKMDLFDRPEGFKEKRAELSVSHIYPLNAPPPGDGNKVVQMDAYKSEVPETGPGAGDISEEDLDNIPF